MADRDLPIRELSDRLQIQDLLVRYCTAIDTGDWDLLDQVFTPDAHIDYTSSGGPAGPRADIKPWLARALAPFPTRQHLIANSAVTLNGDTATARTMVWNPMGAPNPDGSTHFFYVGAWYNDRLVYTPDGWRIAERIEEEGFMDGTLPEGHTIPE